LASTGASTLESAVPVVFEALHHGAGLDLSRIVELCSAAPARLLGLSERKGSLRVGADADVVLIDPHRRVIIQPSTFVSRSRSTPFEGMAMRGAVVAAAVQGELR